MCFGWKYKGYCYLIALWTYLIGFMELTYGGILLAKFGPKQYYLMSLVVAWIPLLVAGICLVVGTSLPDCYVENKRLLLRIWIFVAVSCGFAITIIKVGLLAQPWEVVATWRNSLRIFGFFFFVLLIFCFIYYPYMYMKELEEEVDY